jgi:ABC-type spermidine/putrescine transport system permease subunit II
MEPRETTGERLLAELLGARNSNQSTVTVSAGGVGVWIAVTCCVVSFVINVALAVAFVNHDRKIDDLGDYISAIYMMAPSLKPPVEKEEQP